MYSVPQNVSVIDALPHAEFDRELVHAFQDDCQWTSAKDVGETPRFSRGEFTMQAKAKLVAALRRHPEFRKLRYKLEGSPVIDHLAYLVVRSCTDIVHLRQLPVDDCYRYIRSHLEVALKEQEIFAKSETHPLWGRGDRRVQASTENVGWFSTVARHRRPDDHAILSALLSDKCDHAGKQIALLFKEAVPRLLTLDRTHVQIFEEEFRRKLWSILNGKPEVDAGMRSELCNALIEHWAEGSGDFEEKLRVIGQEVLAEERERRRLELSELGIGELKQLFKTYGCKPPRDSTDAWIEKILALEWDRRSSEERQFNVTDADEAMAVVCRCFDPLMTKEELNEADRAAIVLRLPVLEYHLIRASEAENDELGPALATAFKTIQDRLGLKWKEYPPMAWAFLMYATTRKEVDKKIWMLNI